jgi:hypothetical protein
LLNDPKLWQTYVKDASLSACKAKEIKFDLVEAGAGSKETINCLEEAFRKQLDK